MPQSSLTPAIFKICYGNSIACGSSGVLSSEEPQRLEKECVYMATFIIGLVILFGGAAVYGKFCEKVFDPDDQCHLVSK